MSSRPVRLNLMIGIAIAVLWTFNAVVSAGIPATKWQTDGVHALHFGARTVAISDSAGGIFLAGFNPFEPDAGLRLQHLANDGTKLWAAGSIKLEGSPFGTPAIASDGAGGIIVAWKDGRRSIEFNESTEELFAQRLDTNGQVLWQARGVPLATGCLPNLVCGSPKDNLQMISDGAGGAILTWMEVRDGFHLSVWAQKIRADGSIAWSSSGVPIAFGMVGVYSDYPKLVSDGSGGAILAWEDSRVGVGFGIYAQRVDARGLLQWPINNGIQVAQAIVSVGTKGFDIVADGIGGAFLTWVDRRTQDPNNQNAEIYAQRLNSGGQPQWTAGGIPICLNPMEQYHPLVVNDGEGGAIIVWEDQSALNGEFPWIAGQRVNGSGTVLWATNGVALSTEYGRDHFLISDGNGGAITVFQRAKTVNGQLQSQIILQRIDGAAQRLWGLSGFTMRSAANFNSSFNPEFISDGIGGAIVYWPDLRNSQNFPEQYAQRVSEVDLISKGTIGIAPVFASSGTVAQVPVTVVLGSNVSIDAITFSISVSPLGSAPAVTSQLLFQKDASIASAPAINSTLSSMTVTWNGPIPALTGVRRLGYIQMSIPNGAIAGHTYSVIITSSPASFTSVPVKLTSGLNQFVQVVAGTYLVGDDFQASGNDLGSFGNGILTTNDILFQLRAIVNRTGYRPPSCSDRYDALDVFPLDTGSRGGDTLLNNLDLLANWTRVNGQDASRPTRTPRNLPCPGISPLSISPDGKVSNLGIDTHYIAQGTVSVGSVLDHRAVVARIPLTLNLDQSLSIDSLSIGVRVVPSGSTFSVVERMTFEPSSGVQAPTIIDSESSGDSMALAWLGPVSFSGIVQLGWLNIKSSVLTPYGESYAIQLTGASATTGSGTANVDLALGANSTLTIVLNPKVTITQDPAQTDPTTQLPITFKADFTESVTGFTASDVVLSGTATGTIMVAVSGFGSSYNVVITGNITGSGTITINIPAGAAFSGSTGLPNIAAINTDNSVYFSTEPIRRVRGQITGE